MECVVANFKFLCDLKSQLISQDHHENLLPNHYVTKYHASATQFDNFTKIPKVKTFLICHVESNPAQYLLRKILPHFNKIKSSCLPIS